MNKLMLEVYFTLMFATYCAGFWETGLQGNSFGELWQRYCGRDPCRDVQFVLEVGNKSDHVPSFLCRADI